jgi:hypothetical protein
MKVQLVTLSLLSLVATAGILPSQTFAETAEAEVIYLAQATQAPLGNYTAEMGGTTRTTRVQGAGGVARRTTQNQAAAGEVVNITINSYNTQADLQSVAQAGQGNMAAAISKFNSGTVTIAGVAYPINMAVSYKIGSNYYINLLSSKPFGVTGAQGGQAAGVGVGLINLIIPTAGGPGTGKLYRSSQVSVSANGQVQALRGVSSATELVGVVGGGL